MAEVCGELFIAPVGTPVPKGIEAEIDKAYKSAGYVTDLTMYIPANDTYGPEYVRVFTTDEGYDYKAIIGKTLTWVVAMLDESNKIPKLIVIPEAQLVSALRANIDYIEVTLRSFRDIKGSSHYIYFPKEAVNEQ